MPSVEVLRIRLPASTATAAASERAVPGAFVDQRRQSRETVSDAQTLFSRQIVEGHHGSWFASMVDWNSDLNYYDLAFGRFARLKRRGASRLLTFLLIKHLQNHINHQR
jgi:hypothetical protein